jgi:signal transduction histidine kinase
MSNHVSGPVEPAKSDALDVLLESLAALEQVELPPVAQEHLTRARQSAEVLGVSLHNLAQEVQASNQARAKFVSVVTHELRLPLTSIKGYTDLIRQGIVGPVNDQQKNFLGIVRSNVERMTALISDLADMSHAQSGRIKLSPKTIRLEEIVKEALTTLQPKLDEKGQILEIDLPSDLVLFQADPARLAQILGTILGNAQRYTPAGGRIRLQAREEGDLVRIEVADTGIGIAPEDQARLFTAFFRSEDEAVREHQGWGLALHVASLLIHLMGGQIGAASELRKGSTFWFTLPKTPPD